MLSIDIKLKKEEPTNTAESINILKKLKQRLYFFFCPANKTKTKTTIAALSWQVPSFQPITGLERPNEEWPLPWHVCTFQPITDLERPKEEWPLPWHVCTFQPITDLERPKEEWPLPWHLYTFHPITGLESFCFASWAEEEIRPLFQLLQNVNAFSRVGWFLNSFFSLMSIDNMWF